MIKSKDDKRQQKSFSTWLIEPSNPEGIVIFTHGYLGNRVSNDTVK